MVPKISFGSFEIKVSDLFFYVLFGVCSVFIFLLVKPFWMVIFFTFLVATFFYPWYQKMVEILKGREKLASVLTGICIILLIILPLLLFTFIAVGQAISYVELLVTKYQAGQISLSSFLEVINQNLARIPFINYQLSGEEIMKALLDTAEKIVNLEKSTNLVISSSKKLVTAFEQIAVFIFLLFGIFPMIRPLKEKFFKLSPLPDMVDQTIIKRLQEMTRAVFVGFVVVGLVQATIGGIGLLIVNMPAVAFWMFLMVFLAIIPMLGVGFVLLPIIIILFATGQLWQALVIFIVYLIAINVDNYLRPMLVGRQTSINPLFLILAILGGLKLFGIVGLLFGPMVLVFFITLIEAYEKHYVSKD